MGGWAEMGGIRKSAQFLHLRVSSMGGSMGGNGRDTARNPSKAFRLDDSGQSSCLHVCARNAISCVQGAENAFPAFSERTT